LYLLVIFFFFRFEPSSVLDLISAITTNPKLWQGREMNASKSKSSEGLMLLNHDQVKLLKLKLFILIIKPSSRSSIGRFFFFNCLNKSIHHNRYNIDQNAYKCIHISK